MANAVPLHIKDALYELEERAGSLLPSQKIFMAAPEPQKVVASGWGSGKTHACMNLALVLSAIFAGNRGIIGRFHSTDLEDSTIPVFFDVCPPSWIRSDRKQGPGRRTVTLKNGSEVLFRHLHDPKAATSSRRVGANLGWACIDQLEECSIAHWNTLLGRLRLPHIPKKFLFANMNPAGHDIWYQLFFEGMLPVASLPSGEFFRTQRRGDRFAIAVNAQENRSSNGGFIDDAYFDTTINGMDPSWVARYVYCSFDDFAGKIYREYTLNSVHNIKPFSVPTHWPTVVGIDVGGDNPWHVGVHRIDPAGNNIKTAEFHKPSVNVGEVSSWIKNNCAWNSDSTTYVIDWENKLAMLELAEHGIHCQPAQKKVLAGILKMGGRLHVQPGAALPAWYFQTQPHDYIEKFRNLGTPRDFVFDTCAHTRQERDHYLWDPNNPGKPIKLNDHSCDEDRYVDMFIKESARPAKQDKFAQLRTQDPGAAAEWTWYDRKIQERLNRRRGIGALREADMESVDGPRADKLDASGDASDSSGGVGDRGRGPEFVRIGGSWEVEG